LPEINKTAYETTGNKNKETFPVIAPRWIASFAGDVRLP
jgi:hypothetical protein